jgi:hypothetical protein
MPLPHTKPTFRARLREALREVAYDLLTLHHRLFDPFDPNSMPDYAKEFAPDDAKPTGQHSQTPRN